MLSADNLCKHLDPDQAHHNLDPEVFVTLMVFLKESFEKVNLKKKIRGQKIMKNYPTSNEKFIQTVVCEVNM